MRKPLFSLAMTAALVVAACGSTATQAPSKAPTSAAPATAAPTAQPLPDLTKTTYKPEPVGKRGGKLVVGYSGEPDADGLWFQYYETYAGDVDAFSPSMWGLWNNTADLKTYSQLTTKVPTTVNKEVTVTGDKMDVKVELIPGAQWSDGKPITCADIEYHWKWIMDKANVGLQSGTVGYENIVGVDGGTGSSCVIHFNKTYEGYLGLFWPLLPAHYLKSVPVADANSKLYTQTNLGAGVYSGPYIPTAWATGAQIDFKANPKFWDTIKKAQAPFDTWTFRLYANTDAEIAGFKNKEIDVALEFNHTHVAAIKAAGIPDASIDAVDGVTYEQHTWNNASLTTKFGDAGARAILEAAHYATDKVAITTRIIGNTASPSCSFTTPQTWFYSTATPCYKTDTAKAADVLSKAGFTKNAEGTAVLNGTKVELLACARKDRQYRVDTLTLLASQMAPLGIKLKVEVVTNATLFGGWTSQGSDVPCNLTHGNFDVTEFAWLATPDPTSIYQVYHSKFDPSKGDHAGQNFSRANNPEFDKLLDANNFIVDLAVLRDNMASLQKLYIEPANAFPEIALYNWRTVLIKPADGSIHNISNNGSASTQTWNIEDWWRS